MFSRTSLSRGLQWRSPLARAIAIRALPILLLVAGNGMQTGCALLKKKKQGEAASTPIPVRKATKAPKPKAPLLVGTVTLVNVDSGFALIDGGTNPSPSPGAKLKCKSGSVESAELRVSEIRRQPFTIADIVSGTPNKGDLVYQ